MKRTHHASVWQHMISTKPLEIADNEHGTTRVSYLVALRCWRKALVNLAHPLLRFFGVLAPAECFDLFANPVPRFFAEHPAMKCGPASECEWLAVCLDSLRSSSALLLTDVHLLAPARVPILPSLLLALLSAAIRRADFRILLGGIFVSESDLVFTAQGVADVSPPLWGEDTPLIRRRHFRPTRWRVFVADRALSAIGVICQGFTAVERNQLYFVVERCLLIIGRENGVALDFAA